MLPMNAPRGAGRSGGVLFLVILAFVAVLTYAALDGAARWIFSAVLIAGIVALAANVLRRR